MRRQRRSETPVPVIALVGYTNAGKSTLLNTLTQVKRITLRNTPSPHLTSKP